MFIPTNEDVHLIVHHGIRATDIEFLRNVHGERADRIIDSSHQWFHEIDGADHEHEEE